MGWFRNRHDDGTTSRSFEERLAQIHPGVPGRCPACDGLGYIDSIDIGHRYQIQHCTACLHRWEYLFDADGVVVDIVIDLRDPTPEAEPVLDRTATEQLSPAEWIRRSVRR